jgi:tRNA(Ile)-lysidine synthase
MSRTHGEGINYSSRSLNTRFLFYPMHDSLDRVSDFLIRHRMLEGCSGIVVAVSGGPDSVALLDMLVKLRVPVPLHVAHLDHMLRGQRSSEDSKFVAVFAKKLGLPSTLNRANVQAAASQTGKGIEEIGRELRYGFLLETAMRTGSNRIATGHTMNDQAETFLMRLARGSGLRGLASMRAVSRVPIFETSASSETVDREGYDLYAEANLDSENERPGSLARPLLIRPLLCLTRDEVEAYCTSRNLEFRTDETNDSSDYARNRVRRKALPALLTINARAVEHIAGAAEIIAGDQDALDQLARALLDRARQNVPLADMATGEAAYSVQSMMEPPPGLRRRMIIEAINRVRKTVDGSHSSEQIERVHVEAVNKLLENHVSGTRVTLPEGLEIWCEFGSIVLRILDHPDTGEQPESETAPRKGYEFDIGLNNPVVKAGGFNISLVRGQPGELLKPALEQARRENQRLGRDWMMAVLNDNAISDRLLVRPRNRGERAHVIGHHQTKKLKKLMIDHRIPTSRRAIWPIVATPDGQYVWSPGLPPAEQFSARDETHGLAILRASGI